MLNIMGGLSPTEAFPGPDNDGIKIFARDETPRRENSTRWSRNIVTLGISIKSCC